MTVAQQEQAELSAAGYNLANATERTFGKGQGTQLALGIGGK